MHHSDIFEKKGWFSYQTVQTFDMMKVLLFVILFHKKRTKMNAVQCQFLSTL